MKTLFIIIFFIIFFVIVSKYQDVVKLKPIKSVSDASHQIIISTPPPTISPDVVASEINDATKSFRLANNLSDLGENLLACDFAEKRLGQMYKGFSHDLFYDQTDSILATTDGLKLIGENLYSGPVVDSNYIFNLWIKSKTHRNNLEKEYTHDCVRCDANFCVHIFLKF